MRSISFFDGAYPVRTLVSDNGDWQTDGWRDADTRKAILQARLDVPVERVFYARETHSGNVFAVRADEAEGRIVHRDERLHLGPEGGYDAMVTNLPGIMLCVWTADCLPLFLYDPERHIAAIAHCGWRGVLSGIAANTVDVMTESFGARPERLLAAFGPCICGNCYEVSDDLVECFSERFSPDEIGALFVPMGNGKYLLNIKRAVETELLGKGVRAVCIHDTGICSRESAQYASYRRDGSSEPVRQTLSGIVLGERSRENG